MKTDLHERIRARAKAVTVSPELPLQSALEPMDRAGFGILLLASPDGHLAGVLTDGDIRRTILRQESLSAPCIDVASRQPVTAPARVSRTDALRLMSRGRGISQLPLIDADGKLVGLLLRSDLDEGDGLELSAVVMAGGFGRRLQPLTDTVPKPMLPVGGRPIMERLVEELSAAGIRQVRVTTHHQSEQIINHFGDGSAFGVDMSYVSEDKPLGTAGALSLMEWTTNPILVVNADILTNVDFAAMLAFHREQGAELTVGVQRYEHVIPYGVVECAGERVTALKEKPVVTHLINAGVYILEPAVRPFIPANTRFDMTELIERLLSAGRPVGSFQITEYWLDIGQPADYERAQHDMNTGKLDK